MSLIEREFSDTLQILSDFRANARFIVAFSGGTDSLALLSLVSETVEAKNIIPVYVNHNLRSKEELQKEIKLNSDNCKKLGLSLVVREIERGLIEKESKDTGVEATARRIRYSLLQEEKNKNSCDFILTAHHKDDQVETVLMKIMKGSPVTGLRGISEKWGDVLRPLLEFSKKELEEYLKRKELVSSFDSTNKDNSFSRNEIRNKIIPELKKIMPDCEARILNIRNYAVKACKDIDKIEDSIDLKLFNSYDKAQKVQALYQLWDNVLNTSLPQTLIERVIASTEKKQIAKESANGGSFYSYNGILYLVRDDEKDANVDFSVFFDPDCVDYNLPYNIRISRIKEGSDTDLSIDFSKFVGKPMIRFARESDVIKLKDGTKTIGKLLQDMKIPQIFRHRVPVVVDDEGLCIVFGSCFGGRNRICGKIRTSLALNKYNKYICYKGNYAYEENR